MSQPQGQAPALPPAPDATTQRSSSRSSDEKTRISHIEKSVTHLLHATKTLLEVLTRWSKLAATESEVSDVYVRLGYEFNIACRAFNQIGVDTQDLGPVPDLLRTILEETLSGDPSQAQLDRYLPRIRDIIVNLLQGLKKKQQRLRQRQSRENGSTSSIASTAIPSDFKSATTAAARTTSDPESSTRDYPPPYTRQDSFEGASTPRNDASIPPRSSSSATDLKPFSRNDSSEAVVQTRTTDEPNFAFASPQSKSARPVQDVLTVVSPPQPKQDAVPPQTQPETSRLQPPSSDSSLLLPQPQQNGDALMRLQRGGELERRASRRFSAYHISKHLGSSSPSISNMIPPTQSSPIPNRGQELRESMNAVRVRGAPIHTHDIPRKAANTSPTRQQAQPVSSPEEAPMVGATSGPIFEMPANPTNPGDSPYALTPQEKIGKTVLDSTVNDAGASGAGLGLDTSSQDASIAPPVNTGDSDNSFAESNRSATVNIPMRSSSRRQIPPESEKSADTQIDRSPSSKELTLFLQYKTKIKKFVLPDGYEELSIARLQLAFIEKFAWNTTSNGLDLPEIYIQDPVSGVRHELEDLADVKNRSVLVLNVDAVEEVKKHLDDGLGGLKTIVQDLKSTILDQQVALQRVSDKQQDTAKEITRLTASPPTPVSQSLPTSSQRSSNGSNPPSSSRSVPSNQLDEVQSLRRDLAVMRQTYTSWVSDMQSSMSALREKAAAVKSFSSTHPEFPSAADTDNATAASGRAYVNSGRKMLNNNSESLMTRVEELQDTVEDLRKDVVTRGVRPLPRQLDTVTKEVAVSTAELKKLKDFIKREKPTWTKIWKDELQVVCDDQNLLTYQEELCADLEADLEAVSETFALVEEATKQQNLINQSNNSGAGAVRSSSRTLNPTADPAKAKDGVLDEVRALQPNHETRVEAIERAEKLRQRELESRKDGEFQKELSGFVDEGRLKKSGGVEEAERVRKMKDEMARREFWERVNGGKSVGGPSPAPEAQSQAEAEQALSAEMRALDIPPESATGTEATSPASAFEDAHEAPFPTPVATSMNGN